MKAKRKAHRQLRIELIYQQKKLVSEATGEEVKEGTISRGKEKRKNNGITASKKNKKQKLVMMENCSSFPQRKMQAAQTDNSDCNLKDTTSDRMSNTKEQSDYCSEEEGKDDTKELITNPANVEVKEKETKVFIDKVKENKSPRRDKQKNIVKPLSINTQDNSKEGNTIEVTVTQKDNSREKKKKRKNKLKVEEAAGQSDKEDIIKGEDEKMTTEAGSRVKRKNENCGLEEEVAQSQVKIEQNSQCSKAEDYSVSKEDLIQSHGLSKTTENPNPACDFEENELMTNYDGYWVLREDAESLEAAKKAELEVLYAARTDKTTESEGELTQEEKLALQRAMKKKKRMYHRKLLAKLSKMGVKASDRRKRERNDKERAKKEDTNKVVKFDGFWIKKEAADRLHKLRSEYSSLFFSYFCTIPINGCSV